MGNVSDQGDAGDVQAENKVSSRVQSGQKSVRAARLATTAYGYAKTAKAASAYAGPVAKLAGSESGSTGSAGGLSGGGAKLAASAQGTGSLGASSAGPALSAGVGLGSIAAAVALLRSNAREYDFDLQPHVPPLMVPALPDLPNWPGQGTTRPIRILSIDGGGTRGVVAIQFLKKLEAFARDLSGRPSAPLADFFDLIVGTSTGGLLAINMAINKADMDSCASLYSPENSALIFPPGTLGKAANLVRRSAKYDPSALEEILQRQLGEVAMHKPPHGARIPLVAVVATNQAGNAPFLLRNYDHKDGNQPYPGTSQAPSWLAGRATSAATTFFPAVATKYGPDGKLVLTDGGQCANNPSVIALREAQSLWPKRAALVVSVGTGSKTPGESAATNIAGQISGMAHRAMDSEEIHKDLAREVKGNPSLTYFRFQADGLGETPMDASDQKTLCDLERKSMERAVGQRVQLETAARFLVNDNDRLSAMTQPHGVLVPPTELSPHAVTVTAQAAADGIAGQGAVGGAGAGRAGLLIRVRVKRPDGTMEFVRVSKSSTPFELSQKIQNELQLPRGVFRSGRVMVSDVVLTERNIATLEQDDVLCPEYA